ncbi:MAG: ABC transporter ATP-binding protein [Clostridiaceae bacterium]|nr:ABC transporter ATP-binding protein [Clostridiaceae bacterium]
MISFAKDKIVHSNQTSTHENHQVLADSTGSSHIIEVVGVNKYFGDAHVLTDVTFYIRNNEFITLLGPSGCGKSTTLRILAGFEQPNSGDVLFEGKSILATPPYLRKVNTVFQRYALFPHLNVYDNIAFGLAVKKIPKAEMKMRIEQALHTVDLEGYGSRWVDQLSGGQMQRVAIARAIVNKPQVLLLDEPLGALDLKMRQDMQIELKDMQRQLGITFVYVTHDQEEALTMSDTIIVMKEGLIQQIGTPIDIYNEPKNAFVADFIGESNILPGKMVRDYEVAVAGKLFTCVDTRFPDEDVDVVIRPEDVQMVEPSETTINGLVTSVVFKGVHYEMLVEADGFEWMIQSTDRVSEGTRIGLTFDPDEIHIMRKSAYSPDRINKQEDQEEPPSASVGEANW